VAAQGSVGVRGEPEAALAYLLRLLALKQGRSRVFVAEALEEGFKQRRLAETRFANHLRAWVASTHG